MKKERRVLFLCTGNYYRSRFAEVLFNHLAKAAGLEWVADSSGLNIALLLIGENPGPISRFTVEGLKARGLELPDLRWSKQVSEAELAEAELVVALKEVEHRPLLSKLHPEWVDRVRYWHVHDLDFQGAEAALPEIEGLVRQLVEELSQR